MSRPASLNALRDRIQRIEAPARHGVLPFGVAGIDRALPGGGLALGAVHEILGQGGDEEDGAAAAGFAAGILARLGSGSAPTSPQPSPSPGAERETMRQPLSLSFPGMERQTGAAAIPLRPSGGRGWPLRQQRPGEVGGLTSSGPVLWCLKRSDLVGEGGGARGGGARARAPALAGGWWVGRPPQKGKEEFLGGSGGGVAHPRPR